MLESLERNKGTSQNGENVCKCDPQDCWNNLCPIPRVVVPTNDHQNGLDEQLLSQEYTIPPDLIIGFVAPDVWKDAMDHGVDLNKTQQDQLQKTMPKQ